MTDDIGPTALKGEIIDPELYLKVKNHELRQNILNTLFYNSLEEPISKSVIANDLDIGYHKMLYQLTEHLDHFWKVDYEEKVRGAREEFISPQWHNTIYCLLGSDSLIHIIDPLGDLYGKISDVGVRCDTCPEEMVQSCLSKMGEDPCHPLTEEIFEKREAILKANGREAPYKPIDRFLMCTMMMSLDTQCCTMNLDCRNFVKHK